jgi:hypothetical protein
VRVLVQHRSRYAYPQPDTLDLRRVDAGVPLPRVEDWRVPT